MDLLAIYIMFALAIALLTCGVIDTGSAIKAPTLASAYLAVALNAFSSALILWALTLIIPPAFGIH